MNKLTIITINYNNASGLQKTVESVLAQSTQDFEYIVVDGGSTDGSVDYLIAQNSELRTQNFSFISEKDKGIYNAMNKGIRMAKGDYVQFLNSGDWYVDNDVVKKVLNSLPECDIFVGNVISIRPDGKKRYNKNEKNVSLLTFYRSTIQHTSAFIRKSLFERYGLYDETLRIVSDWKWYLQVAGLNKADVQFTNLYITYFDTTGISSTQLNLDKTERRKVLEELIPKPILADYDKYHFYIEQIQRLKRYPAIYKIVWFIERVLFKYEKAMLKKSWK